MPFPPYSYVPGKFPHPVRDPAGHSFGQEPAPVVLDQRDDWATCAEYRRGVELFNAGYFWEAHESWEAVWHALGRQGAEADFLKGLIKLAAAGVKAGEGRPAGVARHARRAHELFQQVAAAHHHDAYGGVSLSHLLGAAQDLADRPQSPLTLRL